MAPKDLKYRRGEYLAVLGDDGSDFWVCKAAQHVYQSTDEFNVYWMEKTGSDDLSYEKMTTQNRIPGDSVLKKIKLLRTSKNYLLPEQEKLLIQKVLRDKTTQLTSNDEEINTAATEQTKKRQNSSKIPAPAKKKRTNEGKAVTADSKTKTKKKEKGSEIKTKKEKKKKQIASKKEKAKNEKKSPVDKSDPNWRLKPRNDVIVWEKDPLFETKSDETSLPFVSSTAHSRLAITAVLTKDIGLLKKCVEDRKRIHSLEIQRSVALQMSAMHYALRDNNLVAIKTLFSESKKALKEARVEAPKCYLKTFGTGEYNYRSLGIKKIRRLNMSRGGREGNNALTKDTDLRMPNVDYVRYALTQNVPQKTIQEMIAMKMNDEEDFCQKVLYAIRAGNAELAAFIISKDMKVHGIGSSFSRFHLEALVGDPGPKWTNAVREVSVRKACDYGGITPLHCAAINPSTSVLEKLFQVVPDIHMADTSQRKLVHYAAACTSTGPLKFLAERGANLEDVDREGTTPLMVSCTLGRLDNVKFIVEKLKSGNVSVSTKMGVGGVDRPQKNSWRPLHLAVAEGRTQVVRYLLEVGAVADSQLNTTYDKMTPLMLAAANGDLEMVKLLSIKAKIEKTDRYRRTALTHAVMNGSASVVSYLLSRGADPNRTDTSGNTNLHYAAAYGWYFCLVSLMSAGARLDLLNEWKLSPLAVAYLKGNIGIAKYLLDQPGVNINEVNDNGDTILLSMMKEGCETALDQNFVLQIEELIEQKGADPTIVNHSGQNLLHFLAQYNSEFFADLEYENEKAYKQNTEKVKARMKLHLKLLKKLLACGCDTLVMNSSGQFPLDLYLSTPITDSVPNFEAIDLILENMKSRIKKNIDNISINLTDKKPTLLSTFINVIDIKFVDQYFSIFEKIVEILNSLKQNFIIPAVDLFTDTIDSSSNLTPFVELCKKYVGQRKVTRQFLKDLPKEKSFLYNQISFEGNADESLISGWSERWKKFREMIKIYADSFSPRLDYDVALDEKKTKIRKISSALAILGNDSSDEPADEQSGLARPGFQMLLDMGGDIEGIDEFGRTRLVHLILNGQIKTLKFLIDAGADVNVIFESQAETEEVEIEGVKKIIHLKSYPVYETVRLCQPEMLDLLLSKGARIKSAESEIQLEGVVVQRSPLLCAVRNAAKDRANRKGYAIIRSLMNAGQTGARQNGNEVNHLLGNNSKQLTDGTENDVTEVRCDKTGNSVLHIAVNGSSDCADQSLQLEAILIKKGCDLFTVNKLQRYPLHYAFVKDGSDSNSSQIDPVEVVALLLDAMDGKQIDEQDIYGCTPLHYAAFRGATVSCLLLLQKGANIDSVDKAGNTPVAYSVLGNHSGCTLMLLQKDAKINCSVYPEHHTIEKTDFGSENKDQTFFKFLKSHFEVNENEEKKKSYSLFRGIVQNGWLGITYVALDRMERFGVSYARAVEVAFAVQKFQFAKTLIEKQTSPAKLRVTATDLNGSLLHSFAENCKNPDSVDPELLKEVYDLLIEAGLSAWMKDDLNCSALHYACQNDNLVLVEQLLQVLSLEDNNFFDDRGRTPVSILVTRPTPPNEKTLRALVDQGADLNVLAEFPILDHFRRGFSTDSSGKTQRSSPLIVSIVHCNLHFLVTLLELGADVNLIDVLGMTPIMHAVKTNSLMVVRTLLQTQDVDISLKDTADRDVIHHIAAISAVEDDFRPVATYDNVKMLDLVLQWGATPSMSALNLARQSGAVKIAEKLSKLLYVDQIPYKPQERTDMDMEVVTCDYNAVEDAREMLKIFEQKAEEEKKKKKDDVENDDKRRTQHIGCNVQNGELWKDFCVLMTKIDVTIGSWGLYNYYRMEIWKEKHKELFILFTNWGRIGDYGGQYQNTPFATAKQAEEEFEKIFRSKSGNAWTEREKFEQKSKKYRIVDLEQLKRDKKPDVKIDLKTQVPSKLPEEVQEMICDIANVSMYTESYRNLSFDDEAVPFGQIKKEEVEKARQILDKIRPLIAEKEKVEEKRRRNNTEPLEQQMFSILEEIYNLSTEYYYLMPKKGFEFTRLCPLDATYILDQELDRVRNLLEFETAARYLMAAQFRKNEINPLDYIYAAMGCSIQPLEMSSDEVPFILKYIYNSPDAQDKKVDSIFRVAVSGDANKSSSLKESLDHRLLWHGTKTDSLISILTHGLLINPPSRSLIFTGRSFGDGIYTSNTFDKSYCYSSGYEQGPVYMLLCDVAPGKTKVIKDYYAMKEIPPKGYDSVLALRSSGPNEAEDIRLSRSGILIPAGKIEPRENNSNFGYDELVVYNEKRISIRYVVRLAGQKPHKNRAGLVSTKPKPKRAKVMTSAFRIAVAM